VYPANGKFYLQLTDYQLPGEIPLTFRRLYSTKFSYNGLMGYGWTISYNERLYRISNGNLVLRRDYDVTDEFTNAAPHLYLSPAGKYETITQKLDGSYTLRQPDGTIHVFSNDGTLSKIENLKGNQLLFAYDSQGKLPINGISLYSHITNAILVGRDYRLTRIDQAKAGVPNGRYAMFTYNTDGRLTNILIYAGSMAPLSLSYAYAANGSGDLVGYTDAAGTVYTYAYDTLHRMTNFLNGDCACRISQNVYDSSNRVVRQTIGNTIVDFEYLVPSQQTRVTTHIYDDQTLQFLRDRIEYFYFTPTGKTAQHILQMGRALDPGNGESDDLVTTYHYSSTTDELVSVNEPTGATRVNTYDSNGNLASESITNGTEILTRVYQYDANSRLTNQYVVSTPWPGVKFGQRAASFDGNGRVVWEKRIGTNGTELVTTYQYQTAGDHEISTVTDPEGNRMARETDVNGKLVREFDPDNPAYETRYQYDDRGNLTNRIDALGYQTQYAYDELGRVTRETDALGQDNLYTYSGPNLVREEIGRSAGNSGRVMLHDYNANNKRVVTYSVGNVGTNIWMRYGYDSDGSMIWEENATGLRTTLEYDGAGRRAVVGDVYGGRTTNTFDKAGNVVSKKNALGIETRLEYDRINRLTNRIEAAGMALQRQTLYRLDPLDNVIETIQPDGTSTFYHWDAWGRLAQVSGAPEYWTSYQYDGNGKKTITTDGNGYSSTNRYDKYGRLVAIQYPDGALEQFQYDLANRLVAVTDGNTNVTFFSLDGLGRHVATSVPNSPTVTLYTNIYNPWNELICRSNLLGGVERRSYDCLGRLTNSTDAAGLSLTFQYDAAGRLLVRTWPNGTFASNTYSGAFRTGTLDRVGHLTGYSYDVLGRELLQVTSLGLSNIFGYDVLGRTVSVSNSLGHVVRTDYDVFDKPIRITYPDGLVETMQYDSFGQLTNHSGAGQYPASCRYDAAGNRTTLVDGNGNQTAWTYDGRNRVQRKLYADGSFYEYGYDKDGNLRSRRDAKGIVTTYSYDSANRMTRIDYPQDPAVLFRYDALGRRTEMVDGSGTNRWNYDQAGRTLVNSQSRVNTTVAYDHDLEGNRVLLSVNGAETRYTYDAAGRLSTVSNVIGVFRYAWQPDGDLIQSIVYPNGSITTNTYEQRGLLTERRNLAPRGGTASSFKYGYDSLNMRTNVMFADTSGVVYGYDSLRQLTSARGYLAGGAANTNYEYTFVYDPVGNRTSSTENGAARLYYANNLNQYLLSAALAGQDTFSYDQNGNQVQHSSSQGAIDYSWDEENRLIAVTNGSRVSQFLYNGLGLLVESLEYSNGVLQQTRRNVFDGALPVKELDGSNLDVRSYVRGLDLSAKSLDAAGGIGGLLSVSDASAGTLGFYFADGNGNVVDLLDAGGGSTADYEYAPFGKILEARGALASQPFQWSGKLFHENSQLNYYGHRFYHPLTGRWGSRDPLGDEGFRKTLGTGPSSLETRGRITRIQDKGQAANLVNDYSAFHNDPINAYDAVGLKACMDQACLHMCFQGCVDIRTECLNNVDDAFRVCMDAASRVYKQCMLGCSYIPWREVRVACEYNCHFWQGLQEDLCWGFRGIGYATCWSASGYCMAVCAVGCRYTVPDECSCPY
jgi:RHS repeat-associated protein